MEGFVYMTTLGHYVVEGTSNGHGGMKHSFGTTKNINNATIFRTEEMRGTIGCPRKSAFDKFINKYRAIPAKSIRAVELTFNKEEDND